VHRTQEVGGSNPPLMRSTELEIPSLRRGDVARLSVVPIAVAGPELPSRLSFAAPRRGGARSASWDSTARGSL